ncbi:MAG: TIGR03564 family F420-dependent LLM class oxidoreductase [Acidimicrobiales bacterium]
MRIAIGIGSEAIGAPVAPQAVVDQARAAEADGFASAWCVHFSRGLDALSVLAVAGTRTGRIELGVGVVPTYPRHPVALAQQAATVQALCGGRLTLGVGVSHRPVIEGMHGLAYTRPAAHLREYLSVLVPLLTKGSVDFEGELYRVEAEITVPGTTTVAVLVGALSPRMVGVAGELADGVVTWLAGRRTLAGDILPSLLTAAAGAGRSAPRVVAALPVAVTDDEASAREAANVVFARYAGLANYQRVFEREGVSTPADLALVGSEAEVERQLAGYAEAGATELWPVAFPVGPDPDASLRRTREFLRAQASANDNC